ncbi:MAG: V-type ATP synthase subunit D [Eubacteriales bacterium]|jgi:V/A-type H+-transporting ATPase subunit D|nr:V-type ATP synthase subunit D [Eubacteriales bacterium]
MAEIKVNPTRMELKKLQLRLNTARRGHKLLKDKRDELMKQFLDIVRENKRLRETVEGSLVSVHRGFSTAAAVSSPEMLETALMLPKKESDLSVSYKNLMSVNVPRFKPMQDMEAGGGILDSLNYGFAFTSGELDSAVSELSRLLPDMIRLAEAEKAAQMLAAEIEKTRRRVNALEYIMIPQLQEGIRSITMKLDENERGNTTRLMKVKDMMIEKQFAAKRQTAHPQ